MERALRAVCAGGLSILEADPDRKGQPRISWFQLFKDASHK